MKKRNIKAENERVEKDFPKNPDNISKDELHEHFDLNQNILTIIVKIQEFYKMN